MTGTAVSLSRANANRLGDRPCPGCGTLAAALLATLPSGRRALIEACAICGRQEVTPADARTASAPPHGRPAAGLHPGNGHG